jgi:hypothetical protein
MKRLHDYSGPESSDTVERSLPTALTWGLAVGGPPLAPLRRIGRSVRPERIRFAESGPIPHGYCTLVRFAMATQTHRGAALSPSASRTSVPGKPCSNGELCSVTLSRCA